MNPHPPHEGWPGQPPAHPPRSSEPPRPSSRTEHYRTSPQSHHQSQPGAPVLPPPQGLGSYYGPAPGQSPPPGAMAHQGAPTPHRQHAPPPDQNMPPSPQNAQGYSLPALNQPVEGGPLAAASIAPRDREMPDARDRDDGRRDEGRRDDGRRDYEQQSQAEPIQLHQPVAVGPQMRSAIHNGVLSHSGGPPQGSSQPPLQGAPTGMFSPRFERTPQASAQQLPAQSVLPFPSANSNLQQVTVPGVTPAQQPILNDALSYLDQVKVQFSSDPHVYNQFLDIMKDFKSQAIDTPGVIRRVSTLFAGHPNLISGFNTFLPPGYKIECGTEDDPNAIRVTTPMGTQVSPMGSALPSNGGSTNPADWFGGIRRDTRPNFGVDGRGRASPLERLEVLPDDTFASYSRRVDARNVGHLHDAAVSATSGMPMPDMTPAIGGGLGMIGQQQGGLSLEKRGPVEFNHAISYVNKIKNRFAQQPEIYKQFLEILQTYQRESKPIQDVYAQVTRLFDGAPDLLQDFKQFLPESAAHAKEAEAKRAAEDATMVSGLRTDLHAGHTRSDQGRMPPMGNFAPTPSGKDQKRKRGADRQGQGSSASVLNDYGSAGKNGYAQKRGKHTQSSTTQQGNMVPANQQLMPSKYATQTDAYAAEPMLVPAMPEPLPPNSSVAATGEELAFFDRVKKHISNKNSTNEFLKLCNLYSQDLIDKNLLVYRAQAFIGNSPELFDFFKRFLGYEGRDQMIEQRPRPASGRVNLNNCRSLGQSYRHLPQRERQKPCSGRDQMCHSVLNDEWVSHPTWASEDSGFIAHRKNVHEEGLHRIEEERHDYDLNISSLERLIGFLEPLANQNRTMSDVERTQWTLSSEYAGQSFPIYKKTLAKIYGRSSAPHVLNDMRSRPTNVIPVVLQRCRIVCEQWKATQREWEKVWRDQTQRMFWKSLDHQGIQAKQGDKRQFQTKTLQNEIQIKYEEQKRQRLMGVKDVPTYQFDYHFADEDVLLDVSRLIMHHAEASHSVDVPNLLVFLKEFIPSFFGFDLERFQEQMDSFSVETPPDDDMVNSGTTGDDDVASEDSTASRGRRATGKKSDLRRGVLDRGRTGRPNGNPDRSASASRATTPDPTASADDDVVMTDDSANAETWVKHPVDGNVRRNRGNIKPNQPFRRQIFNLYANLPILCFFRMFTTMYDRLYKLKQAEGQVRDAVKRMKASKPAQDLHMMDKDPDNFFGDTSAGADYYRQMLAMFEELVKGESSIDMVYIEDVLRRFYLGTGWQLYSFERMLSSVTRFAIAIISSDGKDRSSEMMAMFYKDRKKTETTHQDEVTYRKQSEKQIKDGDVYRITYHQNTRAVFIRILKSSDATFESNAEDGLLDVDQRWTYYVASYTSLEPTEGVIHEDVTSPLLKSHIRQAETTAENLQQSSTTNNADDEAAEENDDPKEGEGQQSGQASGRGKASITLRGEEQLGLRISPDTYRIFWPRPGSGDDQEWWQVVRRAEKHGAASRKDKSSEKQAADKAAESGEQRDKQTDGEERMEDDGNADHAFEEKFVMNNRWMAGRKKDEVEEKNAAFHEWIGTTAMDVDQ